jgi:hypothetical protein
MAEITRATPEREAVMITFDTPTPNALLARIKKGIDNGSIQTWAYDTDGDFTHTPSQWIYRGWLRPRVTIGGLEFNYLGQRTINTTKEDYAVYHGRFIEMMLAHFDDGFGNASASAAVAVGDQVVVGA